MTFGEPAKKPAADMNRFRRDMRLMWAAMRDAFNDGVDQFWKVPFPEMQLVRSKRTEDA
jgi:hypothetical protein